MSEIITGTKKSKLDKFIDQFVDVLGQLWVRRGEKLLGVKEEVSSNINYIDEIINILSRTFNENSNDRYQLSILKENFDRNSFSKNEQSRISRAIGDFFDDHAKVQALSEPILFEPEATELSNDIPNPLSPEEEQSLREEKERQRNLSMRVNIDGKWLLSDLGKFHQAIELFSEILIEVSACDHIDVPNADPIIKGMHYASPGFFDFFGLGKAFEHIHGVIMKLIALRRTRKLEKFEIVDEQMKHLSNVWKATHEMDLPPEVKRRIQLQLSRSIEGIIDLLDNGKISGSTVY